MVFVMSSRIVPVAAARLFHSGSRRPVPVDAAACCRPRCGTLLSLLVGGVVACCCPLLLAAYRTQVVSSANNNIKKCACQCVRVCLVREMKVNLFGSDVWGYHRERTRAP